MSHRRGDLVAAGKIGGLVKAARYHPSELTVVARQGFMARFLAEVDAHTPGLEEQERQRRATALLRAHMTRLAHLSAKARRSKKTARGKLAVAKEAGDNDADSSL